MENKGNNGVFEIAPGTTTEQIKCMFFDKDALRTEPETVHQLNCKGHRYYYVDDEDMNPIFFPSTTTILSGTMPTPPSLVNWKASMGVEEANNYMMDKAAYGTFMHGLFEKILIDRFFDLNRVNSLLLDYIEEKKLPQAFIHYEYELKKDLLAFAQFVIDYDVKPLAIEIALVSRKHGFAGMIDLPCNMKKTIKGTRRMNCIIDFKSGRKGFYASHEAQLHLYMLLWNENFPDIQIKNCFNFAPKDWRKKPTYSFKDQSKSDEANKIMHYLAIAKIAEAKRSNVFNSTHGIINLDHDNDFSKNITCISMENLVKKYKKEEVKPEEGVKAEEIEQKEEPKKVETEEKPQDLSLF